MNDERAYRLALVYYQRRAWPELVGMFEAYSAMLLDDEHPGSQRAARACLAGTLRAAREPRDGDRA